jgi:hypothetical protein
VAGVSQALLDAAGMNQTVRFQRFVPGGTLERRKMQT